MDTDLPPWMQDEKQQGQPKKNAELFLDGLQLRLFTARKDSNGKGIATLAFKEELKQAKCHFKPEYNGKSFPHWLTTQFTNIANKFVLQHLSETDFEMCCFEIYDHAHPENIKMLDEFNVWAKDNKFIHPRK